MDGRFCFVIMSFNKRRPSLSRRFNEAIRPAVEKFEYQCLRTVDLHYNGRITDTIWECIRTSHFIIADLTDTRPNCFYELGIAHGLEKIVIPVIDDPENIPFDLKDHNFIVAPRVEELRDALIPRIIGTIQPGVSGPTAQTDTQAGLWGRRAKSNDRLLSGRVSSLPGSPDYFQVQLQVVSTDPTKPLQGDVHFHLHETFVPPDRVVKARRGVATLELLAWGAFTVGVEADNKQTRLELDLKKLKSAPKLFRER